ARHVALGLDGRIEMILDGGPTSGGLESTVLDVTCDPPRLLRPGLITPGAIEQAIGYPIVTRSEQADREEPLRSPGQLSRHYAPRAILECVRGAARERVGTLRGEGRRVGWLSLGDPGSDVSEAAVIVLGTEPIPYAARLYSALHEMDAQGVDWIVVELPPETESWMAVHDRLRRAATRDQS
ncbi:MAG: hypothetical protein N2C14_08480, partial [Planctomycetales bacterium]